MSSVDMNIIKRKTHFEVYKHVQIVFVIGNIQ